MLRTTNRRFFRLLLVSLLAVGFSIAIAPPPAYSCSCAPSPDPLQALAEATAVFSGRVTDISQHRGRLTVTFDVDQQWKGETVPSVVITTSASTAMCGFTFELNETYLVYASESQSRLQTGQCSRTTRLNRASADLSQLGESQPCW